VQESWQVPEENQGNLLMGNGLYANIHKRRAAGKTPRKVGSKGAPSDAAFRAAAKTAKPKKKRTGRA